MLVQKRESPSVVISVPSACRSNRKMSRVATASRTTVAPTMTTSRARRWSCVGVTPRATLRTSRVPARTDCDTIECSGRSGRIDANGFWLATYGWGTSKNRFSSVVSEAERGDARLSVTEVVSHLVAERAFDLASEQVSI